MEYVRLALGGVLFFYLIFSLHKSYWYYNKKNIFEGHFKVIIKDIINFPRKSQGNLGIIMCLFPECHSNPKGKFWAKVHWFCWFLVVVILAVGLTFFRE